MLRKYILKAQNKFEKCTFYVVSFMLVLSELRID